MTKRDLVVKIANETGIIQTKVADIVQLTLDNIAGELISGKKIELRNFGVFEIKIRKSRKGSGDKDESLRIRPSMVLNPSKFYSFMDSASCTNPTQYGYFTVRGVKPSGAGAYQGMPNLIRHNGVGNIVFFDGHVGAVHSTLFLDPWDDSAFGNRGDSAKRIHWTYDGKKAQ